MSPYEEKWGAPTFSQSTIHICGVPRKLYHERYDVANPICNTFQAESNTLSTPRAEARSKASKPSSSGRVSCMSGSTSTRRSSRRRRAAGNGPQREPTMVTSSTTTMLKSRLTSPWKVLLSTRVPRGRTKARAMANPPALPVASTTRSAPAGITSSAIWVRTPRRLRTASFSACRPTANKSQPVRPNT